MRHDHDTQGGGPSGNAGRTPLAVGGLALLLLVALSLQIGSPDLALGQATRGVVRVHQQLAAVAVRIVAASQRRVDEHTPARAWVVIELRDDIGLLARRVASCARVGAVSCPANHLIDLPPPSKA